MIKPISKQDRDEWRRLVQTQASIHPDTLGNLLDAYEQQAALLAEARGVVEKVEWVELVGRIDDICPWCNYPSMQGHKSDCPRQAFLAKLPRNEDDRGAGPQAPALTGEPQP